MKWTNSVDPEQLPNRPPGWPRSRRWRALIFLFVIRLFNGSSVSGGSITTFTEWSLSDSRPASGRTDGEFDVEGVDARAPSPNSGLEISVEALIKIDTISGDIPSAPFVRTISSSICRNGGIDHRHPERQQRTGRRSTGCGFQSVSPIAAHALASGLRTRMKIPCVLATSWARPRRPFQQPAETPNQNLKPFLTALPSSL